MAGEAEVQDFNEGRCELCNKAVPKDEWIILDQHAKQNDGRHTIVRSWYCGWKCLARHASYVRVYLKA